MGRFVRFGRLDAGDRWLLIRTAAVMQALALGLHVLPFRTIRRVVERVRRGGPIDRGRVAEERVLWAIGIVGRHAPWTGSCLVRALAGQVLLARLGCASRLRIGVTKDADGRLRAHAWLEQDGRVLLGGTIADRYLPLPLEGELS